MTHTHTTPTVKRKQVRHVREMNSLQFLEEKKDERVSRDYIGSGLGPSPYKGTRHAIQATPNRFYLYSYTAQVLVSG